METSVHLPPAGEMRPAALANRIDSVDVLRGVALLGILLMNIFGFGVSRSISNNPALYGGTTGVNMALYTTQFFLFEGRMRALFSMLFGAGVILLTSKAERMGGLSVADIYYRRLLWLLVFGLIDAYLLLWTGDVLYAYAICGLFLFPFRNLTPRYLVLLGLLFLAKPAVQAQLKYVTEVRNVRATYLSAVAAQKQGKKLTSEQREARKKWDELTGRVGKKDNNQVEADNRAMRGSYADVFAKVSQDVQKAQSVYFYKGSFWDIIGMMFIGMAFLKWGVFTGQLRRRQYVWMIALGYGSGLAVGAYVLQWIISTVTDFGKSVDTYPLFVHPITVDIRRLTIVVGHIGLIMLVVKSGWLKGLTNTLAAVGQMAFTNYLVQSVLCGLFFYGFGLGYYGKLDRYEMYFVVLGVWAIQLIYSPIWLRYFRFGPMEWLWRSLTYWKRQPMRRTSGMTPHTPESLPQTLTT